MPEGTMKHAHLINKAPQSPNISLICANIRLNLFRRKIVSIGNDSVSKRLFVFYLFGEAESSKFYVLSFILFEVDIAGVYIAMNKSVSVDIPDSLR